MAVQFSNILLRLALILAVDLQNILVMVQLLLLDFDEFQKRKIGLGLTLMVLNDYRKMAIASVLE
jgi:hypothetical protein